MKVRVFVFIFLGLSCQQNYLPKPRGYARVDLPIKTYQIFNKNNYPFSFEYPRYAIVTKDSSILPKVIDDKYWLNINIPSLGGTIYLSYKDLTKNNLSSIINDCFTMTFKHAIKATSIEQVPIKLPNNSAGFFFKLQGDVATANQFYVSDSIKNFLRGTLYFDTTPNEDSLSIVNDFILKDMYHLVNTLKWKN